MPSTKRRPPAGPATPANEEPRGPRGGKLRNRPGNRPRRDTAGPGVPGPSPKVLIGFRYDPPGAIAGTTPTPEGMAAFAPDSPAGRLLTALAMGCTWTDASALARLHPETARQWNTRGQEALSTHESIDALHATDPVPETLAYAAFHLLAAEARAQPVGTALGQIIRASDDDWRAAAHVLKVLPQARDYREVTRHTVAGDEDGGPVAFDLGEFAAATMLDLAQQFAANPGPPDPQE